MRRMRWVTLLLAVTAVFLLSLGIARGEPREVAQKAVNICLECIGVG